MRSNANIPGAPRTSDPARVVAARPSLLRVCTAAQALARDHAVISAGVSSFSLMVRAGSAAAESILRTEAGEFSHGVAVYAGGGNNGGDAYIVAAQLVRAGVRVRLHAAATPRTADAKRAEMLAAPYLAFGAPSGDERLVIDGLLGTGHVGALRDPIITGCLALATARARGARIVALDMPTGVDATTGDIASGSVVAHRTLSFGTLKRGQLIARAYVGAVQLLDIGLGAFAVGDDEAWRMLDAPAAQSALPHIAWNAHKGTRGHVALVGGASGMVGAITLATRAALATGAGLARAWVDAPGVAALQQAVPQAIASVWPTATEPAHTDHASPPQRSVRVPWGTALAIGPGLGRSAASLALLHHALAENVGVPTVLDADALTLCALHDGTHDSRTQPDGALRRVAARLHDLAQRVPTLVLTPHAGEFARLIGAPTPMDWQTRAESLNALALQSGCTVLLKGTPSLIAAPDGTVHVVARGTAALATGGSGDMLTGMIGALLAQGASGIDAAVLAATAHGLAAELATKHTISARGYTLDDIIDALPEVWHMLEQGVHDAPRVLASLPDVSDAR